MPFYYTDHTAIADSSVISDIYYNNSDNLMVVALHSGALAGYEDVPADVAKAFMNQEAQGGSVGRYWNTLIKPTYTGFSTEFIDDEFVSDSPVEVEDKQPAEVFEFPRLSALMQQLNESLFADNDLVAQAPVQTEDDKAEDNLGEFTISFTFEGLNGDQYEAELTVFAVDNDHALVTFQTVAEVANYKAPKVNSLTHHYA